MTDDVLKHIALELLSRGDPEQASYVLQAFSEAGIRVIFDLAVVDANDLGSLSLVQKRRLQIVQRLFLQQQQRQQQYDPTWWMNLRPEYLDSLVSQQEQEGQRQTADAIGNRGTPLLHNSSSSSSRDNFFKSRFNRIAVIVVFLAGCLAVIDESMGNNPYSNSFIQRAVGKAIVAVALTSTFFCLLKLIDETCRCCCEAVVG